MPRINALLSHKARDILRQFQKEKSLANVDEALEGIILAYVDEGGKTKT